MTQQTWASHETRTTELGDKRLNRRLGRILEDLSASPGSSIPQASGTWAASKACYNFLGSKKVTAAGILASHQHSTIERIGQHRRILAVQDTSELDFTAHGKTSGLGYLHRKFQQGIIFHTSLAVSTQGEVLGVLAQQSWTRPNEDYGKKHQRRRRPTSEKETQRWLEMQQGAFCAASPDLQIIAVADREADFYEFFAAERPANAEVLLRVTHNRRVEAETRYLRQTIEAAPEAGEMLVELGRSDGRPARQARLSIRYTHLRIHAPSNRKLPVGMPQSVEVSIVLASEVDPPADQKPIEWLLLTSLPITTLEDAIACVGYYTRRWLIERFHYTLKSGCGIEQLQLESAERLQKALAVLSIVAWRLLWLLYHARVQPEASAEEFLERHEWQILYVKEHRGKRPPSTPPTLQQAVLWIAKLGGFLARRGDGTPGIKTLWRGLRRLNDLAGAWKLAQSLPVTYG
jgi:hypothetical protein